jgi:mono/diheme cytochrome c family protein
MRVFPRQTCQPGHRWRSRAGRVSMFALLIGGWIAVAVSSVQTSPQQPQPAAAPAASPAPRAVLDKYCVACHNQKLKTAEVALDALDVTRPSANADVWERVIRKLRSGSMPPGGRPRPDQATYHSVTRWLETEIDRAAAANPNPGRTASVHRLNRAEYRNVIRDLLTLDVDVAGLLPAEDTSDSGFDNNAEVLSIAPAHLERYMSAARKISRLATGIPPGSPVIETFRVPYHLMQDDRTNEDLPLGSRGGIAVRYYFPVDADYSFRVRLRRTYVDYVQGMGTPHQLDLRVDGELVKRFTVGGGTKARPAPDSFAGAGGVFGDPEWEQYALKAADEGLELQLSIKAGPRLITAAFVRKMREPQGILHPRKGGSVLSNSEIYHGNASVDALEIGGPYRTAGPGDTPSRRRIFTCQPQRVADEEACAAKVLSRLARHAYRGSATPRDVQTLMEFFKAGRADGGSFEAGVQFALERLLVEPRFLLRVERDPAGVEPGRPYRLGDLEVASRLSFFLWSSIPDETLLDLAEKGTLTSPSILEQQVRRMLADARAQTMVDNFANQWLHLRKLDEWASDTVAYPYYDDNLKEGFRRETELFIASTLREDRSVLDLLRADYTFVNERLARHYGIPGIYGSRFRRVTLPDTQQRGGLLGHGALLMLSSYPDRTSPVLRGKWLLDSILGAPPPAPPPDVPALPERGEGGKVVSVRERLEQHRKNAVCASCHASIDPLGFALEHYDGIGAWREATEEGRPVDASGTMPSGATVDGLQGLRALLLSEQEQFVGTLTEKLLAYGLGRGLEYYDQPTVRKIVSDAEAQEYRWSSLILGIVNSPAFLRRNAYAAN